MLLLTVVKVIVTIIHAFLLTSMIVTSPKPNIFPWVPPRPLVPVTTSVDEVLVGHLRSMPVSLMLFVAGSPTTPSLQRCSTAKCLNTMRPAPVSFWLNA